MAGWLDICELSGDGRLQSDQHQADQCCDCYEHLGALLMLGMFMSIMTGVIGNIPALAILDRLGGPIIDRTGNIITAGLNNAPLADILDRAGVAPCRSV